LQIEYSLLSRGIEDEILPTSRELGIGITAYGVLSRGLISEAAPETFAPTDFRAHSPRFQGDNLAHNRRLVGALAEIADANGISVAQLAIAWVLTRGDDIVPLIGTRRRDRLADSLGSLDVVLSDGELNVIEQTVPSGSAAGERYNAAGMASLDSER
jgi:aryl-alcohol dehydrogenase-like predicted oxidoreductase